jgi:hypothetical protein
MTGADPKNTVLVFLFLRRGIESHSGMQGEEVRARFLSFL